MSEKTPIPAADPFRISRIAAAVLAFLTLCAAGTLVTGLMLRPSLQDRRAALRSFLLSIDPPAIAMQAIVPSPPPGSRHDGRFDWRFSPQVPAALLGTAPGSAMIEARGRPQ